MLTYFAIDAKDWQIIILLNWFVFFLLTLHVDSSFIPVNTTHLISITTAQTNWSSISRSRASMNESAAAEPRHQWRNATVAENRWNKKPVTFSGNVCQFARKLGIGLRNRRSGSVSDDCYTISLIQFGKSFSQSNLVVLLTSQAYGFIW